MHRWKNNAESQHGSRACYVPGIYIYIYNIPQASPQLYKLDILIVTDENNDTREDQVIYQDKETFLVVQ